MIRDLGIVKPGKTLYLPFHTFDSNDPSASVTITGLALADIDIYKDGNTTERASTSGYTLLDTDGIDFDGATGIHGVSIDLSDNTTANFYEAGSQYWVVINAIAVDAATVRFVLATFTIGYPDAILNSTIATLASQTSFTLEEGPADNDALNGCPVIIHDLASDVQIAQGLISDYVGSTRTVTLVRDPGIFTMAVGDNVSVFVSQRDAVWDEVLTGSTHNVVNSAGRRLRALQDLGVYEGGMVWIDTVNGTAGTTDFENGTVNNPVDTIADAATIRASVGLPGYHVYPASTITFAATQQDAEFIGHNYTIALGGQDIGNMFMIGATISGTFVDTTAVFEDCIINAITGAGITMRRCFFNEVTITANAAGNWFLNECRSRVAGTGSPNFDFGAVGNVNLNLRNYSGGIELENMAAGDVASIEGDGNIIFNANCTGGTVVIRGNFDLTDNAGGAITVTQTARPASVLSQFTFTVANQVDANAQYWNDTEITTSLETAADVADAVWDEPKADHTGATTFGDLATDLDAVLADTNELQGDWVNGGRLDLILDARASQTSVDTVDTNVDAILVDTGTTLPASIATVDTNVDNLNLGIIYGTAQTGTLSTTVATTDLTGYLDDELIGRVIVFTGGTADGQASDITDYAATNGTITFTAVTTAPANGDSFKIV